LNREIAHGDAADRLAVILVVGVNGSGKTTTIGKLASRYAREGLSVILAAAAPILVGSLVLVGYTFEGRARKG
jgi:signal recognition particle GTPase